MASSTGPGRSGSRHLGAFRGARLADIVLVDAAGTSPKTLSGEIERDLTSRIEALLEEGRRQGVLSRGGGRGPEPDVFGPFLRFPGRWHVAKDRLFIADSGHQRSSSPISEGRVQGIVGEAGAGAHDGPAGEASFHNPQGMTSDDPAPLLSRTRQSPAARRRSRDARGDDAGGTGRRGASRAVRSGGAPERGAALSVGAAAHRPQLLIAMAGSHQIWV